MNRFIRATSDGHSQCYNCGTVSWDSFMFKEAILTYKLQIKILQAQINNDYGNGSD